MLTGFPAGPTPANDTTGKEAIMDHDAIFAKAAAIISETLDVDVDDIAEDTEFKALEADSFDMLELVSAFEDEFDMEMPDDGLDKIVTVGDVVAGIEAAI
jgi:acyl carrier protein